MMAVVTASGTTKRELLQGLRQAIRDLERESANNCLAAHWEYEVFETIPKLVHMVDFIKVRLLQTRGARRPVGSKQG